VSFGAHNCIYNANEFKPYSLNPEDEGSISLRNDGNKCLFQVILRHQNRFFTQDEGDCGSHCPLNVFKIAII
jgi:hypothetical protein